MSKQAFGKSLHIPEELHKPLKVYCSIYGKDIKQVARELVEEFLKDKGFLQEISALQETEVKK